MRFTVPSETQVFKDAVADVKDAMSRIQPMESLGVFFIGDSTKGFDDLPVGSILVNGIRSLSRFWGSSPGHVLDVLADNAMYQRIMARVKISRGRVFTIHVDIISMRSGQYRYQFKFPGHKMWQDFYDLDLFYPRDSDEVIVQKYRDVIADFSSLIILTRLALNADAILRYIPLKENEIRPDSIVQEKMHYWLGDLQIFNKMRPFSA